MDKGCSACHNGINVGGGMYAPFGVVERPGSEFLPPTDKGRFEVTRTVDDEYVFKVPTLRNIALTAPYFQIGKSWDLRQAVAVMGASQLGIQLTDEEVTKITEFLHSLTGEQPEGGVPHIAALGRRHAATPTLSVYRRPAPCRHPGCRSAPTRPGHVHDLNLARLAVGQGELALRARCILIQS